MLTIRLIDYNDLSTLEQLAQSAAGKTARRFDLPTIRDADTPLVRQLMAQL